MATRDWWPNVAAVLDRQKQTITRRQAEAAGMSPSTIKRYVADGRWKRRYTGVFVATELAGDHGQRLWAAALAAGPDAVVSFEAAAALYHFEGFERGPLVFTRPHGNHRRLPGIVVHQIDDVAPHHLTRKDGLLVTKASRTAADLASKLSDKRLSLLVQHAVVSGAFELTHLAMVGRDIVRPGKPGARNLCVVLDRLFSGETPGESWLEQVLINAIAAAGGPPLVRQAAHPGRSLPGRLVDLMTRDGTKIIIEADGRTFHGRLQDMARDRERDLTAAAAGYVTLRVMWEQLRYNPDQTVRDILEVHQARLRQLQLPAVG
jgi:hypothetical protein